jgi:cytochrome c-type biogenesis protein CcmH
MFLALILSAVVAQAENFDTYPFESPEQEARFDRLTQELRCPKCQNQSLADSNAPIAHDLRLEVLRLMREGKSDAQIKQFLVERYTEFVLYKPEVKPMTWLLWFGPGMLVLAGGILIIVIVKRKARNAPAAPPSNESQEW